MIIQTQAFVLRAIRFRESSLIVTLFTNDFGKVKAVCKGVHRPKSRKGSHFEPLNLIDVTVYDKPNRELQLVTDSALVNYYMPLRENYEVYLNCVYVLELVDRMTNVHLPHETLFKLMHTFFGSIKSSNRDLFTLAFEVKLLKLLGIFPNLGQCILCKEMTANPVGISFEQGGVICDAPDCASTYYGTEKICGADIVFLFKLIKDPFSEIANYGFETLEFDAARTLISTYIAYLTDDALKSTKVLNELKKRQYQPAE
jgi:DNA repair protein RecO (recombination protein O)